MFSQSLARIFTGSVAQRSLLCEVHCTQLARGEGEREREERMNDFVGLRSLIPNSPAFSLCLNLLCSVKFITREATQNLVPEI